MLKKFKKNVEQLLLLTFILICGWAGCVHSKDSLDAPLQENLERSQDEF